MAKKQTDTLTCSSAFRSRGFRGSGTTTPFLRLRHCPRGLRLVFAAKSPFRGLLRWRKQPPNPRRSHIVSTGVTSRMSYGRGLRS
jgi:hypothetical protein